MFDEEISSIIEALRTRLICLKDSGINYVCDNKGELMHIEHEEKPSSLEEVRHILGDCHRCKLSEHRKNIVFGSGNPKAEVLFVGEAPGAEEDIKGLPFVGRAGQLLTKMIEAMGLIRDEVYICNIIKCRPQNNRDPEPEEISSCKPFLLQQLDVIKPKVIIGLGRYACQSLLATSVAMSHIRGVWHEYNGIKFMPTFHPAYLLRNPAAKKEVWEDLQKVMSFIASISEA